MESTPQADRAGLLLWGVSMDLQVRQLVKV